MILGKMTLKNRTVMSKYELLERLKKNYLENINKEFGEILITAGAGDIDMMVEPIKDILKEV
jgi:UDP-N-acetylmuramate--alanine ligase